MGAATHKAAASTSRVATTWQLARQNHSRRPKNAQAKQAAAAPQGSPPDPHFRVWTGTGSGQRSHEHRDGCLRRLGHLLVHPFASSQLYLAKEDIKIARGKIKLWGLGGVADGSAPPPPPPQ